MNDDLEFVNHIVALLGSFGEVEAKRIFGGFGIFHAGLMIALNFAGSQYS